VSKGLKAALAHAETVFDGKPAMEEREYGFEEELADEEVQVRKACRYLAVAHELVHNSREGLAQQRHFAAAIEMSFCAAERSCHAVLMHSGHLNEDDIWPHYDILGKSELAGLWTAEESQVMAELYRENRAAHYYRKAIPSLAKAKAILAVATEIHRVAVRSKMFDGSVCLCKRDDK
jgi:hypothetical protein